MRGNPPLLAPLHLPQRGAQLRFVDRCFALRIYPEFSEATSCFALADTCPLDSNTLTECLHCGRTRPAESVTFHGSKMSRRSSSDLKSASPNGMFEASGGALSVPAR